MADIISLLANAIQELFGQSTEKPLENNSLEVNLENAHKRLRSINENIYPEYAQNPRAFLAKTGALWFVRKDLEAARFFMSDGTEGYGDPSRISGNGLALADPRLWELRSVLAATEAKVREMEKAKGYTFAGVQNNNIFFKNLETGKGVSAEESGEL